MMRELGEDRLSWTEDGQRILGLWPVIFLSASSGIFVSADHVAEEAIAGLSSLAADHWVETAAGRY